MQSDELMLSARGVGLRYRRGLFHPSEFWALKAVSFDVLKGETLGIIGANGSGKSSVLRILAGIHSPDEGVVTNFGNKVSLLSLQLGFVPQLSGKDNVILGGMLLGLRRKYIESKMQEIIDFTGLKDFFKLPLSTYSSGMRARLGFAVANMADPEVLLIDEVLGVGDEDFRIKSTKVMHERIKSNKTIVLVSHSASTIKSLCDRALWMEKGRVKLTGPVDDIVDAYMQNIRKK